MVSSVGRFYENKSHNYQDMKRVFSLLLAGLLFSLLANAQPFADGSFVRPDHHTHRLPGVNERRLARLEKMREANQLVRQQRGPFRAKSQAEKKKGLVLLVQFTDDVSKLKADALEQWTMRFNQRGYSLYSHVGSVRDFFYEQSYGLLDIDFDVVGPLTVSNTRQYFGTSPNNNLSDRAAEMVIEAVNLADSLVNYADYDWDGNGEVDQVYVIYAGITKANTAGYIWPHEWVLDAAQYYGCGSGRQTLDGVRINTYAVSQELADASTLMGIGTACHEFSHCLGYPDFYDTSYSGGTAAQRWDVLDSGSYNGPRSIGEVPSPFTAYERWLGGWIDLIPLTEPCKVTDMPAINEEGVAYIIKNSGNSNEYYILENRQKISFGKYNGGHGLMVWHVDYNRSAWVNNTVNTNKARQRMTFLPADGKVGTLINQGGSYYYNITAADEAGDPYPGQKNITEVQPLTWYTAEKNGTKEHGNLIHNISESTDGKICFIYGNYTALPAPAVDYPTNISEFSFCANWLPVPGADSYTLQVMEDQDKTVLTENFSGFKSAARETQITTMDNYTQTAGWTASAAFGTGDASVRLATPMKAGSITSPQLTNRGGQLTVVFDASYYQSEAGNITVSVLKDGETLASQAIQLSADRSSYTCSFPDVPAGCNVSFKTARAKRAYIYNVSIKERHIKMYEGLTTTSHMVEQATADVYYYCVQAVCAEGTSDWSEWMSVDIASPVKGISEGMSAENAMYDLTGRRLLQTPQRGLYIQGGRVHMKR